MVVCDGFVGNVALKTSEGVAQMLSTYLREEFRRNLLTKFAGLIALPVINAFKRRVDHADTMARACWGCVASSSRATDRLTVMHLVSPSHGRWMRFEAGCCATSVKAWRSCRITPKIHLHILGRWRKNVRHDVLQDHWNR